MYENNSKKYYLILEIIIVLLLISVICLQVFDNFFKKEEKDSEVGVLYNDLNNQDDNDENENQKEKNIEEKYYIDVKGAVKKPGVYEVSTNSIVNDVINMAGGLKTNASTKYLNLSKKLSNEMVLYIYTNSEIKSLNEVPKENCVSNGEDIKNCVDKGNSIITSGDKHEQSEENDSKKSEDSKININTATESLLTTLSGIGEAKAKAIVEYRNTKGIFKSIEDIKNVTGISESIYEKIKNNITI